MTRQLSSFSAKTTQSKTIFAYREKSYVERAIGREICQTTLYMPAAFRRLETSQDTYMKVFERHKRYRCPQQGLQSRTVGLANCGPAAERDEERAVRVEVGVCADFGSRSASGKRSLVIFLTTTRRVIDASVHNSSRRAAPTLDLNHICRC